MKELEKLNPIEQHEERQQQQSFRALGPMIHKPGLTMFEYNLETKALVKAEFIKAPTSVTIPGDGPKHPTPDKGMVLNPEYLIEHHSSNNNKKIGKMVYKSNCFYFEALRLESAAHRVEMLIKAGILY